MKSTKTLPTSTKIPVGNVSHTSTPQASSSLDAAKISDTLPQSQKLESLPDSMPVGNPSLQNLTGKKLPTRASALDTMALVAVSTLNWLLVRLLYLELGSVGKSTNSDYYEIRLPTSLWEHDGRVFRLVGNPEDNVK